MVLAMTVSSLYAATRTVTGGRKSIVVKRCGFRGGFWRMASTENSADLATVQIDGNEKEQAQRLEEFSFKVERAVPRCGQRRSSSELGDGHDVRARFARRGLKQAPKR